MKKKIIGLFVCLLLLTTSFPVIGNLKEIINEESKTAECNSLNGGWIEEREGVTILHTSGSNYDMGYQQGSLLMEMILESSRAVFNYLEQHGISYNDLLDTWDVMKEYTV